MPIFTDQLSSLYHNAFDWIDHNIDLFRPPEQESADDPTHLYQVKALGELGLLCMLYYRYSPGKLEPVVERFLRFISQVWVQPAFHENIVRKPALFQMYAMIYVVLRQCNIIDETDQESIQRMLDYGYVAVTETTPMRLLDRRHMLDCGGFRHDLPSYAELYSRTLLAKTPPLITLTDSDVYAITHTLFYLTDFGRRSAPTVLTGEHLLTVRWNIETLLGLYLRRTHWDLVGELLLNCLCLHWYPEIIFAQAWESLLTSQLSDGSFPGPRFSPEQAAHLKDEEKAQYCFEQNYHTTLVIAITGFLTLQELAQPHNQKEAMHGLSPSTA